MVFKPNQTATETQKLLNFIFLCFAILQASQKIRYLVQVCRVEMVSYSVILKDKIFKNFARLGEKNPKRLLYICGAIW